MREWSVELTTGNERRVRSDRWDVTPNGDLVFIDGPFEEGPYYVRAFAAGTWEEVRLYA